MTPNQRKDPSLLAAILGIVAIGAFIVIYVVTAPLLAFLAGMLIGYVVEWVAGEHVVTAFNAVGMTGVQAGNLPQVFGLGALTAFLVNAGLINKRKGDD